MNQNNPLSGLKSSSNLIHKIKETAKHSLIFVLGSGVQSALTFLLLPVITKNIVPAEYGIYSIVVMVGTLASGLFYLGGTSAMSRFYFDETDAGYRKKVFSSCFLITLVGFLLQIVFGLVFAKTFSQLFFGSTEFTTHIFGILLATGLGFIFNFLLLHLRIERRSVLFSVANILMFMVNFGVTYVLLEYSRLGIAAPIIGLFSSNLFGCLVLVSGLWKNFVFKFTRVDLVNYLTLGIPAVVISLSGYLLDWLDRLVLNAYAQPSDVGIYSFGCRIGLLILALYVQPFSMVWSSIRWEFARDEDTSFFFAHITKLYTFIGVAVILFFSLFLKDILAFVSRNVEYEKAGPIIPIIFLAQLVYGYLNILDFGIYVNKRLTIYVVVFMIGIILNVGLNILFIPSWGYFAAAYSKLITFSFCVALIHLISNRYFPIRLNLFRLSAPLFVILPIVEFAMNLEMTIVQRISFDFMLMVVFCLGNVLLLFGKRDKLILKEISRQVYCRNQRP